MVGTLPFRIGALVSPGIAQPFTVVSDNSEMYVYFSVSENKLRQFRARYGSIDKMIAEMPEVSLQLNDGTPYGQKGYIETVSGVVNPTTGAVQIKALFPNPDRELLSGTIGNVILQGVNTDAILVPMTATVELQDKIITYRLKNGEGRSCLPDRGSPERRQLFRCKAGLVRGRHHHYRRHGTGKGRNDRHT